MKFQARIENETQKRPRKTPYNLRFIFFKSVYIDTLGNSQQPSDQY